ncbi:MAG TPA: 1,4-dihydroxy-6-naphthoate synthase [Bacteroidia bacterium]|jgi:1,4-dihydroxy-6-naphthoate synthase|nr:1,4-dihydroxy-6-naphthoate synthase [Bacteroidia bacterium]
MNINLKPKSTQNTLTLGFSPCPNDCFIFDALVHKRIDTEELDFEVVMADVEALNRMATEASIDITKLSYHAFAYLTASYALLDAGSALGFGVGPLLIARKEIPDLDQQIGNMTIAIPGRLTTANFLLSLAFPGAQQKMEMLFSDIEEAVLNGTVDAGLIIHENRFTYQDKGLYKLLDLGAYWESVTSAPIPLGGIVINRKLSLEIQEKVNRVLRRSVEYAFAHPQVSRPFVKAHAQEMDEAVMQKHIDLYVNKYSIELGKEGRAAVKLMFEKARELGLVKEMNENLFVQK